MVRDTRRRKQPRGCTPPPAAKVAEEAGGVQGRLVGRLVMEQRGIDGHFWRLWPERWVTEFKEGRLGQGRKRSSREGAARRGKFALLNKGIGSVRPRICRGRGAGNAGACAGGLAGVLEEG
eukprot:s3234_g1.t1